MNNLEVESTVHPNDDISREIPGILHAVAVGCAIGVVSVFVAVGGAVYLGKHDVAGALALGGMSAVWGGLGFGAMFGGTLHVVRHSDEPHSSAKALLSAKPIRQLEVVEAPPTGNAVAGTKAPDDRRAVQDSSQVA